jgi:hypothetical protein
MATKKMRMISTTSIDWTACTEVSILSINERTCGKSAASLNMRTIRSALSALSPDASKSCSKTKMRLVTPSKRFSADEA